MPTERGWAALGAGLGLGVLWYLLGETELGIAAVLLMAAVVGAVLATWERPRLQIGRRLGSAAVHDGEHASVHLNITNPGRALRHLSLVDSVEGLGTAEFATAGLLSRQSLTAHYRVLCRPRGVYSIGPANVIVTDPLGLAGRRSVLGPVDKLVVFPAVEPLMGLPGVAGKNQATSASRPEHNQRGGEDFYTLRQYQRGDDLRRVHWPSSARRDKLMIKQLETPWEAQALVVLDVRPGVYPDEATFEKTVSGAASVVRHLHDRGFKTAVWTGSGSPGSRPTTYPEAMERLAIARRHPIADISRLTTDLRNTGAGGLLVLATGQPDDGLLGVVSGLATAFPAALLLASAAGDESASLPFHRRSVTVVAPGRSESWTEAWSQATGVSWQST